LYKADLNGAFKPLMIKNENGTKTVANKLCPGDIDPNVEE
jgi:hypothetical protein